MLVARLSYLGNKYVLEKCVLWENVFLIVSAELGSLFLSFSVHIYFWMLFLYYMVDAIFSQINIIFNYYWVRDHFFVSLVFPMTRWRRRRVHRRSRFQDRGFFMVLGRFFRRRIFRVLRFLDHFL